MGIAFSHDTMPDADHASGRIGIVKTWDGIAARFSGAASPTNSEKLNTEILGAVCWSTSSQIRRFYVHTCFQKFKFNPLLILGLTSGALAQSSSCMGTTLVGAGSYLRGYVSGSNSAFYKVIVPARHALELTETRGTNGCVYSLRDCACFNSFGGSMGAGLNHFAWENRTDVAALVAIQALQFYWTPGWSSFDFDLELNPIQ